MPIAARLCIVLIARQVLAGQPVLHIFLNARQMVACSMRWVTTQSMSHPAKARCRDRQKTAQRGHTWSLPLSVYLVTITVGVQISVFANDWKLKLEPEVPHHVAKGTQVRSPLDFRQCPEDAVCFVDRLACAFVGVHEFLRG